MIPGIHREIRRCAALATASLLLLLFATRLRRKGETK